MKSINRMIVAAAVCLAGAALAGRSVAADTPDQTDANAPASGSIAGPASDSMSGSVSTPASGSVSTSESGPKDPQSVIALWPDKTKTAAQALIDKYGPPDAVSDKMLSWNDRNQWSMVGVFRDAVAVKAPASHDDIIVNKISYAVPDSKVSALVHFDRGLVVDLERGCLAAHGDSEQHNVLALNLANEIITGKRDVASARSFMKKTLAESMAGKSSPYADGLMFTPSSSDDGSSESPSSTPEKGSEPEQGTEQGAPQNPQTP